MASWSRADILEFIAIYKSEESLWKIESPLYCKRSLKDRAYNRMLEFVLTFDSEATRETVLKKINTLRTSFRKELRKVKASRLSGCGADEVYKPKLWYFNDLLFTQDRSDEDQEQEQEQEEVAFSSLEINNQIKVEEDLISVADSAECMSENLDVADSVQPASPTPLEPTTEPKPGQINTAWNEPSTSKRKSGDDDELARIVRQRSLNPPTATPNEDQFDCFGKLMALKMRNLPYTQRVIAERLCHDVMYNAELGNLSRKSIVLKTTFEPFT